MNAFIGARSMAFKSWCSACGSNRRCAVLLAWKDGPAAEVTKIKLCASCAKGLQDAAKKVRR